MTLVYVLIGGLYILSIAGTIQTLRDSRAISEEARRTRELVAMLTETVAVISDYFQDDVDLADEENEAIAEYVRAEQEEMALSQHELVIDPLTTEGTIAPKEGR